MKRIPLFFLFMLAIVVNTFATAMDNKTTSELTTDNIVIEVTLFNLNQGVDPAAFRARDAEIEEDFSSQQPGFLKRMSGVDPNGKYVVMVFWETLADADASIAAFGMDPTVGDYFAMIDGSTFSAERYTTLQVPDINFTLEESNVIEITTFNLNSDVNPTDFAERDTEIEADFSSLQPGFIRRTSGVDANEKYAVIVFWESLADADASIAAFGMDPTVGDYFAMIDGNTFAADRYTIFESPTPPLSEGLDITLRNTLQDPDAEEQTYASLFGKPDDAFDEFASLSNSGIEFESALAQTSDATGLPFDISGLYEIDFTDNTIDFTLIPDETDPFWIQQFGTFPAGKFDRYYFTFSEPHNITSFSSDNSSVNLRIESDHVVVVELSEGYDFNPGISFSIHLNPPVEITMRNTLEEGGVEATYASLFGAPDDAFDEFATFSNVDIEFASALAQNSDATGLPFDISGLYEIDFTDNSIDFTLIPDETDPFWIQQFGTFPAGKFDRYYFTFSEPHNITSFTCDNSSVNLRIDSDHVVVVELSEGYDFNPGISFSIHLNPPVEITMRNTLEEGGVEATYASLFGAPDDAFDEFATFSNVDIEFATALAQNSDATGLPFDISGLYEIDFTDNTIDFTLIPDETDPFWIQQFGTFPAGKFDRYYFTFSEPHNITSFTCDNSSVNLRIDSDHVVVVELSEGYDFNPGISFSINLNELTNEQKAIALQSALATGDPSALDYISDDQYTQHNLSLPDGKAALAGFYTGQPIGITVDIHRSMQVGDYVILHTTFGGSWGAISGTGSDQVVFDVWRFEDGLMVEHWDNIANVVDDMDGTTQTDGAVTPATGLANTGANQALLEEMAQTLFVNGDWTNVSDYFDLENYIQHSVGAGADGAFLASLEGQTGLSFYDDVKFIHTLGNFGLVMSQGPDITGQDPNGDYAYYDLFRIENDLIVEHWDIIQLIPEQDQWANDNGKWGDDAITEIGVDLKLELAVANQLYDQYTEVDYIFTVTNEGDETATNVVVDVALPEGMVYTTHNTSNSEFNLFFEQWTIPTVAPGASVVLDLTLFTLIGNQEISYFSQIQAQDQTDADSTPGNDTDGTPDEDDEAIVTINDRSEGGYGVGDGNVDLELSVTTENLTFGNWEHIFFTISLTNNGPDAATGIVVSTPEPMSNGIFAGANPSSISTGTWSEWAEEWIIDELAAGATTTLTLDIFTLGEETPITLFSQVFITNEFDPDSTPGNNTSQTPSEDDESAATATFLNLSEIISDGTPSNNSSINNPKLNHLSLFPNPANNFVTITGNIEQSQTGNLNILSIKGELLKTYSIDLMEGFNRLNLEVSELRDGLYILQIRGNEGVFENKRFTKITHQ